MKLIRHPLLYLAILFAAIPLYIGTQQAFSKPEVSINDLPTRRELFQSLRQKGEILIIYPETNARLKHLAEQLSQVSARRTSFKAQSDHSLTEADCKEHILMLLGSPKSNKITGNLLPEFPIQIEEDCILFDGQLYKGPDLVISLPFYPNPLNKRLPIMLITAPHDEAVADLLEQQYEQEHSLFRWSGWGYEIYQNNCRLLMGHFDEKTWEMTKEVHFDYTHNADTLLQTPNFQFISHLPPDHLNTSTPQRFNDSTIQQLNLPTRHPLNTTRHSALDSLHERSPNSSPPQQFNDSTIQRFTPSTPQHLNTSTSQHLDQIAQTCERSAEAILDFTGQPKPKGRIDIHLYGSAEDKGLMWLNTDQSHTDPGSRSVHTVFNEIYQDNLIGKENQLLLRELLGQPKLLALENGLSIFFTTKWQMKGYDYWSSRLFHSGNMPPLTEILDNRMQAEDSRLVLGCLSASLVEFLIQYWGKDRFLANYNSWQPDPAEIHGLENAWHDFLAQKPAPEMMETQPNQLPTLKGFNFSHEGYNIYNGYLSRLATASLQKQVELNANAVAIIPYSFLPDPNHPDYIRIANGSGMENDESVVHAAFQAKKLGMTTMLKPQIWLGRGSWPGDVEMKSEADWQLFFDHYYRWIRHYALMAEIYQMDVLCIGTEFAKATLQREEDWRRIIRKIRKLYSGKITYAANWGDEFEKVGFWNELDFIGLDCYYPLSKKDKPSQAELRSSFKEVIKKIETVTNRYNKPLIFTEIGFRSIDAPWKNPHADSGDAAYNGEHQELCYKVVFEALKGKDWCQGIFWWKFPTDSADMGWEQKGFTPNRKPAEVVVKEWFGRWE